MHTLNSKLLMLALLVIGVVAMSFALVNKQVPEANTEVKASQTWHYDSNDNEEGDFRNPAKWSLGEGNCGTGGTLPCDIEVPANSTLEEMLGDKSNDEVLAINPESRRSL